MADTTAHMPSKRRLKRARLQHPPPRTDDAVLMHEDMRQMLTDMVGCLIAMRLLSRWLKNDDKALFDVQGKRGLLVLMDGVVLQLETVKESAVQMAFDVGVDGVHEFND